MAALNATSIATTGVPTTLVAASVGGDTIPTGDDIFLEVNNSGAAPATVTLVTPGKVAGLDISDEAVAVAAGARVKIGPVGHLFADPTTGRATVNYSDPTNLTVGAFRL